MNKHRTIALLIFLGLLPLAARAQSHEYSPLQEKVVNYKNWTLNDLKDNKPVDLRSLIQGKKLVMVVYFAPWCGNWKNEGPVAAKLYEKYKDQGFQVIGVSEYGTRDAVKTYFAPDGPPYPVVTESEGKEAREFDGEHYIMERGMVADLAIVHAWKGDTEGNLVYRKTARNFNPMMATAGRITIAEVEHLVEPGQIDGDHIITPGIYVQRIVHVPNAQKKIEQRTVRKRS